MLTGGVGGAKLVLRLQHVTDPQNIAAIVDTDDDFTQLGLRISSDLDTLLYTLSGLANQTQGWGREGEGCADRVDAGDRSVALASVDRRGFGMRRSGSLVRGAGDNLAALVECHCADRRIGCGRAGKTVRRVDCLGEGGSNRGGRELSPADGCSTFGDIGLVEARIGAAAAASRLIGREQGEGVTRAAP